MNKEIVVKEDQLPTELLDEITASAGVGTAFDSSEMQIPFIRIIQAMSPQANKKDDAYIEGSGQGDAFNTVTNEFWGGDDGLIVVPCYQETKFLEFVPLDNGGGFVGEIEPSHPDIQKATRDGAKELLPNGNELYNWSVTKHGLVQTKDILGEAKLFREQVMKGAVKAVDETEPLEKDDVPF